LERKAELMADRNVSVQVGPNFLGLLTILFIALKLTGYIAWSWWWVLSPLWLGFVVVIGVMAIVFLFAFLWAWVNKK
jgi:hypothetical protein